MIAIQVLLWIVVAAQACAIVILVHQFAELKRDPHLHAPASDPLPLGSPAPDFETVDVQTRGIVRSDRWRGTGAVLLFVSPSCAACKWLLEDLCSSLPKNSELVVYCNAEAGDCVSHLSVLNGKATLLARSRTDVSYLYRVNAYPVAVSVDPGGDVAEVRLAPAAADIVALMGRYRISQELSVA